jgi:hypothetical protein
MPPKRQFGINNTPNKTPDDDWFLDDKRTNDIFGETPRNGFANSDIKRRGTVGDSAPSWLTSSESTTKSAPTNTSKTEIENKSSGNDLPDWLKMESKPKPSPSDISSNTHPEAPGSKQSTESTPSWLQTANGKQSNHTPRQTNVSKTQGLENTSTPRSNFTSDKPQWLESTTTTTSPSNTPQQPKTKPPWLTKGGKKLLKEGLMSKSDLTQANKEDRSTPEKDSKPIWLQSAAQQKSSEPVPEAKPEQTASPMVVPTVSIDKMVADTNTENTGKVDSPPDSGRMDSPTAEGPQNVHLVICGTTPQHQFIFNWASSGSRTRKKVAKPKKKYRATYDEEEGSDRENNMSDNGTFFFVCSSVLFLTFAYSCR